MPNQQAKTAEPEEGILPHIGARPSRANPET